LTGTPTELRLPGATAAGDQIRLITAAGAVDYAVAARRTYARQRLPRDLFARGGPARLALITCGGRFADGHYDHNLVVYARPA
jgi:hypothetical protein